jgi:hypothetical protein
MDSPNMKRISLYLDKKLVKKADSAKRKLGYSSRNEFFTVLVENFIANEMIKDNSLILSEKLSKAVADLSEDNAKAISKGLFRYAVELEMITRIIAQITDISAKELEKMRTEAVNNVRRTRGKVHLDEILKGYYNDR